jgi:hypothetical protein
VLFRSFTFATNAPLYVVGNFNADGVHETGANDSSTQPETDSVNGVNKPETPALIAADTVTFLSHGWADSAAYYDWRSEVNGLSLTNLDLGDGAGSDLAGYYNALFDPVTGKPRDGSIYWNSRQMSNRGKRGNRNHTDWRAYWEKNNGKTISNKTVQANEQIEISAAVISGVARTPIGGDGTGQTSGGVHNFFRFLEDWVEKGANVAYRGSILGLFEPEVHTELMVTPADQYDLYRAPGRLFGYNIIFQHAVPPGTPTGRTFRTRSLTFMNQSAFDQKMAELAPDPEETGSET